MNEVENNYIASLNSFPAIMGWPSTSFQSCVQVGFLRSSPYMFWIVCKCFETLEFLRLWLANRSPHSPANCGDEYHGQTCVQRMSNTLHIVDIWSNFIGTKARDAEDWEVKNMFESWQSRCRALSINRCLLQKLKTLHLEIKTVLGLCLLRSMALWLDLSHLLLFFCRPHFCFHAWQDTSIHSPNTMHSVQMRPQPKLA